MVGTTSTAQENAYRTTQEPNATGKPNFPAHTSTPPGRRRRAMGRGQLLTGPSQAAIAKTVIALFITSAIYCLAIANYKSIQPSERALQEQPEPTGRPRG